MGAPPPPPPPHLANKASKGTDTKNLTELKTDLEFRFEKAQHIPENTDTETPTLRYNIV